MNKNIKIIISAFKEPEYQDTPFNDYKSLSMSFHTADWRTSRPNRFQRFNKLIKEDSLDVHSYLNASMPIPKKVLKLYIDGKLSLSDLEEGITQFILEVDSKTEQELDLPPRPKIQKAEKQILDGYIYVIRSGGYHKIGRAKKLCDRIKTHQTSNPLAVELVIEKRVGDYIEAEIKLHQHFQHKRVKNEWFQLGDSDLEYIESYLQDYSA